MATTRLSSKLLKSRSNARRRATARASAGNGGSSPAAPTLATGSNAPTTGELQLEISIGRRVRLLRQRLQLTATELAAEAGLSPGMLSKIENGGTSPSLSTLKALARALNVPLTSFSFGLADPTMFPREEMVDAVTHIMANDGPAALNYGVTHKVLVDQIIERLARQGVTAKPEQVLVTYGSGQLLGLLPRVFVNPGDVVIIEGPTFMGSVRHFQEGGANLYTVPVDDEVGSLGVAVDRALVVRDHGAVGGEHLTAKVAQEKVLEPVLLAERDERVGRIRADAHDLGARGLELRQSRVEAADLLRSETVEGLDEGLDEGMDDDGALGEEVAELDGPAFRPGQGEVGRLLPDLEGGGGADAQDEGEERSACRAGEPVDWVHGISFLVRATRAASRAV